MANRYPEAGLLYGRVFPIDAAGHWYVREAEMVGWGEPVPRRIFHELVMVNVIPTPTVVVRKACLDRVGLFDESFSYCEDWDLWLRIALQYDVIFVPEALAGARVYEDIPSRLAAYESEMSQIRILEKVFSNLPDHMKDLTRLKTRAVASRYLTAACRDYALSRVAQARAHLTEALSLDETYLTEPNRFIRAVVDQGFFLAGPAGTCEDVFPIIDRIFADLPPIAERYAEMKSKAQARVYVLDAFRDYQGGELPGTRRKALQGVFRDLTWLSNRGVVSMLIRSLVGQGGRGGSRGSASFEESGLEWAANS
jgi:hypothetical protein